MPSGQRCLRLRHIPCHEGAWNLGFLTSQACSWPLVGGTWFCVAFSILATGPSYPVALLSSAEAFLSTRARSLPCPEPRCRQGPRSDCPTAVARLRPGAGSLSPGRMQQVPGPYISPSPGLLPRGLALSFCHSSSLPAFSFFASWVSFPITRFIQLSESRTRS